MQDQLLWTDSVLLLIILISTLLSLRKGFFDQIFSILGIGIAIIVAIRFSDKLADSLNGLFKQEVLTHTTATTVTFFILFLLLSKIFARIVKKLKFKKLRIIDRLLGVCFGFIRGIIIASVFIAFNLFSPYEKDDAWLNTPVTQGLHPLSNLLLSFIPDDIEDMIKSQIKSFDDSAFVNQTKKLFNTVFDAGLEIGEVGEDGKIISKEKTDEKEQLQQLQKTRLINEESNKSRMRQKERAVLGVGAPVRDDSTPLFKTNKPKKLEGRIDEDRIILEQKKNESR